MPYFSSQQQLLPMRYPAQFIDFHFPAARSYRSRTLVCVHTRSTYAEGQLLRTGGGHSETGYLQVRS